MRHVVAWATVAAVVVAGWLLLPAAVGLLLFTAVRQTAQRARTKRIRANANRAWRDRYGIARHFEDWEKELR